MQGYALQGDLYGLKKGLDGERLMRHKCIFSWMTSLQYNFNIYELKNSYDGALSLLLTN